MRAVIISGWMKGFNKVGLTLLLHQKANLSLAQAKAVTDAVLNHEAVELKLPEDRYFEIIAALKEVGVSFVQKNERGKKGTA